jgi:hypothetical protein
MVWTWAAAARNAVEAGFDAIEIHAAHIRKRGFMIPRAPGGFELQASSVDR